MLTVRMIVSQQLQMTVKNVTVFKFALTVFGGISVKTCCNCRRKINNLQFIIGSLLHRLQLAIAAKSAKRNGIRLRKKNPAVKKSISFQYMCTIIAQKLEKKKKKKIAL